MWRDKRVRDAGVAGSANEVTDGRSCCGSANSTSIGHHQRRSVGGTHRDRISETLGGRSEEISQVCVVWGKAVALSRYHVSPTMDCFGKHCPSDKGGKFTFYLNLEAFPRTVGMNGDARASSSPMTCLTTRSILRWRSLSIRSRFPSSFVRVEVELAANRCRSSL